MALIERIVETARKLGADRLPFSLTELHDTFLQDWPEEPTGRTKDSFSALLNFHTVNMRSRFPNVKDKQAPAVWMTQPCFKRISRGQYMLLSAAELTRFSRRLAEKNPLIYQDEFDVDDL